MPKQKLFDEDSDEEVTIKTENEYAKKYDTWREKEEIHKLEQKYGNKALNSDASITSDSEDESDEPPEVSEEVEEQFLKTLALLKTKDPRIYDPNYKFFENKQKEEVKEPKKKSLTFADSDEDDDNDDGNIFSIEKKAQIDDETSKKPSQDEKEVKLKDYLTGKAEHIDTAAEAELAPLRALWADPQLNEGEAFLRDYILNKRYLEEGEEEDAEKLRDDEALEEDERRVEEQGQFERAYNFRFEEPDQEFLKRFPRTMNYIRPKDDRRSKKRAELRSRKEEEKKKKMEEIARLKALKLKEIREKIERIKEVTGNDQLAFQEEDLEGDFEPEAHDRRMRAVFDELYYAEPEHVKPQFRDLDAELEIENWDNYEPEADAGRDVGDDDGPHCEDVDFNMDADYDPKQARANLLEAIQSTLGKKRRNRKKKSKLAKLLSKDKPTYIPDDNKTYDQYMEEYYKMDCEDVIGGDLPTRFKYREVVPNDYGLTIEEILLADDKELTQWVPLKKLVKHRPESVQKSEINTYRQKAADISLKKKILPSLFKELPEEPELVVTKETKKKKKKNKDNTAEENELNDDGAKDEVVTKETKKKKNKDNTAEENELNDDGAKDEISEAAPVENSKSKKKKKHKSLDLSATSEKDTEDNEITHDVIESNGAVKKKKKKRINAADNYDDLTEKNLSNTIQENSETTADTAKRKNKRNKNRETNEEMVAQNINPGNNNEVNDKEIPQLNRSVKGKKKKNKGFKIDEAPNATPSQSDTKINNNLKRKAENHQEPPVPNKKKKNKGKSNEFQMKFNNKDKFKKTGNYMSTDNPLGKLSDERLKAYGLNPKKYRSFLKYKKF